jgi:hypothetical protein
MSFADVVTRVLAAFKQIALAVIGLALLTSLAGLIVAENYNRLSLAQSFGVVAVCLVVIGVIVTSARASKQLAVVNQSGKTDEDRLNELEKKFDDWLLRLVVVTALGICMIVLYSLQWLDDNCIAIAGVALLSAGGSWLLGLVIGFLFGIPHLSSPNPAVGQPPTPAQQAVSELKFAPSTSLEQIADWLTKIIIGLGLTELKTIPHNLNLLASYIGTGMGDEPSHKVFALSVFVYFLCCGFLFGFLWARLYMEEAFAFASYVKRFIQKMVPLAGGSTPGTPSSGVVS